MLALTELALRLKSFVLLPVLSKYFGAVNFGVWAQVSVIVSMLSPVLAVGLDSAMLRFLPGKGPQEIARGFSSVTAYLILACIPIAALLWLAAGPIASAFFTTAENARFVAICGALILVGLLLNQCRNVFRVAGSAKGYAAMALVQAATGVIVGVGVAIGRGTVWSVVWLTLLADAGLLLVAGGVIIRRFGLRRPDFGLLWGYLRFGLPLVPAGYAMWVLNSSDRLFIGHYGSLADLGVYSAVYSLGYMFIAVFFNPLWVMYPSAAAEAYNRGRIEEVGALFRSSTKAALGLIVPATVGFAVLSVPLLRLLTSAEFVRGASLVPIITAAYVLHMMSSYFDVSLGLVGKQVWSTISISIGMVVNIGLNLVFIPRWGILGAAITTLIGFSVQFALSASIGSKSIPLPFDLRFFLKALAACGVMAAVVDAIPVATHIGLVPVAVVVGACVYVGVLMALRALSPADLRALLRLFRFSAEVGDEPMGIIARV